MHIYHNPKTCGHQPINNQSLCPNSGTDGETQHEAEAMMEVDDHGDDTMPFELTLDELDSIMGETDTVAHSLEQKVHIDLLHILQKAEAPDYLFQHIVEWASRSKAQGYNFSPSLITRNSVLKDYQNHFNFQELRPTISELKLESVDEMVPIVSFDFHKLLVSILTQVPLMQPDNLVINPSHEFEDGTVDVMPWFQPFNPTDTSLDEVLSGKWYKETIEKFQASAPNSKIFVCPLIFYVDKTFIDPMKSRFNLEPLNFTLAIFKRSCRTQFRFWRTLGFIPDTPDEDEHNSAKGCQFRNYHHMLKHLLRGVLELQQDYSKLDNFPLRIGNHVRYVNLRIPIAFIISDTQGADKLCGRYVSYTDKIKRLHRSCMCSPLQASDSEHICEWVEMEDMMGVIDRGDPAELKLYSQHHIPDHAFRDLDFGNNKFGIYGATPSDMLHGIKLGIVEYVLEVFLDVELNPRARHNLDQVLNGTLPHLKQNGTKNFPRMYFPNGITHLKNTTGDEKMGIMFMIYILCCTTTGKNALTSNGIIDIPKITTYIQIFGRLLLLYGWMSTPHSYWELEDLREKRRASRAMTRLIDLITENCERKSSQGWNLSKIHELLHLTTLIELYGAPINYDAGPGERMHQDVAKKPGRAAQKRHESFTMQAAERLANRHMIDFIYNHLVGHPTPKEKDNHESLMASKFVISITTTPDSDDIDCKVTGLGALSSTKLKRVVYPGLLEFIVSYFSLHYPNNTPKNIICSSEAVDEDGNIYRAHHDYRGTGFWHDWAMASFLKEGKQNEFSDVPVKILCFLPEGTPSDGSVHVVCHACKWRCTRVTAIVNQWKLVPENEASVNGIPYDIIPISALTSHCLIVPDTDEPGSVLEVIQKNDWAGKFVSQTNN